MSQLKPWIRVSFNSDGARCPYCEHIDTKAYEYNLRNEDTIETTCKNCGEEIEIMCEIIMSYGVRKLQG